MVIITKNMDQIFLYFDEIMSERQPSPYGYQDKEWVNKIHLAPPIVEGGNS